VSDFNQIQAMFDAMERDRAKYHLTLGRAIAIFGAADKKSVVVFSNDGKSPKYLASYRGYYSDLMVGAQDDPMTVGDFLKKLRAALDQDFTGYKGGEFMMHEKTPLWRDEYGCANGNAIVDAVEADGKLILVVKKLEDA
jgi:hypothetical protein